MCLPPLAKRPKIPLHVIFDGLRYLCNLEKIFQLIHLGLFLFLDYVLSHCCKGHSYLLLRFLCYVYVIFHLCTINNVLFSYVIKYVCIFISKVWKVCKLEQIAHKLCLHEREREFEKSQDLNALVCALLSRLQPLDLQDRQKLKDINHFVWRLGLNMNMKILYYFLLY